jgi:hypothetical protein
MITITILICEQGLSKRLWVAQKPKQGLKPEGDYPEKYDKDYTHYYSNLKNILDYEKMLPPVIVNDLPPNTPGISKNADGKGTYSEPK